MNRLLTAVAAALIAACGLSTADAANIFANFNVDEGRYGYAPSFSATSVGEDATSTADRVTTDAPLEGAGHQKLVLVHDVSTTALRIRHVSGGPAYNSANAGTPVGNTGDSFTTGAGTDGWIGFLLKTTATGWQTSINIDGPGGTIAEMDGSLSTAIISDGQWHLYEWNLDATGWGSIPGIGGGHAGGLVANSSHTIDSIYFRDLDGSPGPTATIYMDFVAKSDSGSILAMLPSPLLTVSESGNGILNGGNLDFGTWLDTDPDPIKQLTITNTGTSTLFLSAYSTTSPFSTSGILPTSIAVGATATLDVVLDTANQGLFAESLMFSTSNVVGVTHGSFLVNLTGKVIPEPSTFALAGLALVGVAVAARRRVR